MTTRIERRRSRLMLTLACTLLLPTSTIAADPDLEPPNLRSLTITAVKPEYPFEARRDGVTGKGIVVGCVDYASGTVTSVAMDKSTGNRYLDQACLDATKRWRFKPKTLRRFRIPITFRKS
jgi:TonB family protein